MAKNNIAYLFIFLQLALWGCQATSENNPHSLGEKTVFIDLDQPSHEVSYKDYFSKVEIIPLETNENSYIKQVEKITLFDNKFFVLDQMQSALMIFDEKGKFLKKIQKNGHGPGEYQLVYDFDINPFTHNLELLDPHGWIMVYDLEGNFKEEIVLNKQIRGVHGFINISPDTVLLYSQSQDSVLLLYAKSKYEILKWWHEVPKFITWKSGLGSSKFYRHNGQVYFTELFSNQLYSFDKDSLKQALVWDFGKYNFSPENELSPDKDYPYYFDFHKKGIGRDIAFGMWGRLITDPFVFTTFASFKKGKRGKHHLIYRTDTKEYKLFDQFKEGGSFFDLHHTPNGVFDILIPTLLPKAKMGPTPEMLDAPNRIMLENITENNNPVIVRYYFKEEFL